MTKFRRFGHTAHSSPWNAEALIREELFSVERLEQHAASLAVAQQIKPHDKSGYRSAHPLSKRLKENDDVLLKAYRSTALAVDHERHITPAAEWLLDNYHLVEEQVRKIRDDLPSGYYRQLPKLTDGYLAGYPRVLGIAWAFVAHTHSRFDPDMLCRFVMAYQAVQPLTIGELWAIAISLRILLIENLRRAADYITYGRISRHLADSLADQLLNNVDDPKLVARVAKAYKKAPFREAFAVQLIQRLRDQDPSLMPALSWLETEFNHQNTTSDEVVRAEHQREGATNVTVRNIITSMRLISDVDWTELFERVSLVDDLLSSQSDFAQMDFATRNLYRATIEELAQGSHLSELEVTQAALTAAAKAVPKSAQSKTQKTRAGLSSVSPKERQQDPGYYLIAGGRRPFEKTIRYRIPLAHWPQRIITKMGISSYIAAVTVWTVIILAFPLLALSHSSIHYTTLMMLGCLGLIPTCDVAIALVNLSITRIFKATSLPALKLRDGIPSSLRTMVVVPTLLTTLDELKEQIDRLEIHHLASQDGCLHFALLSDWMDADAETTDSDTPILNAAIEQIAELNKRYGGDTAGDRFLLFHRRRVWNDKQQQWIGWERKRGKLHEFNRLLRGATDTTFIPLNGHPPKPPEGVRYVITLDSDTRLPLESARRLVGKMAHPLNQPRLDPASQRVVEGYAVLQPRVTASLLTDYEASLFQRVFSTSGGIDPYASAVSDVYQDLFGEGSYAGKGIYDVDAFEAALSGRVPDNSMLSHDLFEGVFARAGLVSDIEVIEEFPSRYDVSANRQHRWVRGDWQLLPWLLGRGGALTFIGFWKMLDNLRRSLSAPASIVALLVGFTLPWHEAFVWTNFILASIALPTFLPVVAAIMPRQKRITLTSHFRSLSDDIRVAAFQSFFLVAFLAHHAWVMIDAIGRTLFRLFISHRKLLEWVTAAQAKVSPRLDLKGFYVQMGTGIMVAVVPAILLSNHVAQNRILMAPLVTLWLLSPIIARWSSLPLATVHRCLITDTETQMLRLIARRTWRFFETFVTPAHNMLPPDNFQEDPRAVVAHRTSPTNMGLYLLSAISANDFGWSGKVDVIERLEATLNTMQHLEQSRGHFYNWYDTQDCRPLDPRYISSVDSGNLAGHLIAVANTCREWSASLQDSPDMIKDPVFVQGVIDNVRLAQEILQALVNNRRMQAVLKQELTRALETLVVYLEGDTCELVEGDSQNHVSAWWVNLVYQARTMVDIARALADERNDEAGAEILYWAEAIQRTIDSHHRDRVQFCTMAATIEERLLAIETTVRHMVNQMGFEFLFDTNRKLLSIGYLVQAERLDESCYDLLASEARLASFVAIAKGDIPAKHWFRLGRSVTPIQWGAALISWSGSMFEYLMPALVMESPTGSLLEQTNRLIVHRQITYGASLGIPWGVSESAYNIRDKELTYQYSNFGVPGLGLKRGLSDNKVISPYATVLAAMIDPKAAVRNLMRLAKINALGRYGFYEALDYTPSRLPEGKSVAIVKAYMAHHQGMSIVSLANTLLQGKMRARFHIEPCVQAAEFLLQERTPRDVVVAYPRAEEVAKVKEPVPPLARQIRSVHYATPETHVLSNGRYKVVLTGAGSGSSNWNHLSVTRWMEDVTRDDWGSYIYLRDCYSGDVWSAGYQPSGIEPSKYEVTFTDDRAEFMRRDGSLITSMEVIISPEDDAEVRRVSIVNRGNRTREIELTSYAEIVLAPPEADAAHLAFSKLFVQTSYLPKMGAVIATRRRRSPSDPEAWAAHLTVVEGHAVGEPEVETDRARFMGRGRGVRSPISVMDGRPLSNTIGTVLDPIFSLRRRVSIPPGGTAHVAFWTLVAPSYDKLIDAVDKHHDVSAYERTSTLAWTHAQVQLRHLGISQDEASLFQRLGGYMLFTDPQMRPSSNTIRQGTGGQSALWSQGISGDRPIMLVRIDDIENIDLVRQILRAYEYLRLKQVYCDLVILNERASSYVQDLQIALETLVRTSQTWWHGDESGEARSIYVLRSDLISMETATVLPAVAKVVLNARRGSLWSQLNRLREPCTTLPVQRKPLLPEELLKTPPTSPNLEFFNGLGGFSPDGREYVTILQAGQSTPMPWINVISNPTFGFQVSAEGSAYTWSLNSRENKLTPWSNDPVTDRPGEVIYIRDDDTGKVWTPTAMPIRDETQTYTARHGQGYSQFEHCANDIDAVLTHTVPLIDSIKISRLTLTNQSGSLRRLSVTAYVEWVLGVSRHTSAPYVVTDIDAQTGALLATNPWNTEYASRVAFMDMGGRQTSWTDDRREFLGRHSTLDKPLGLLSKAPLSKRVGAGLDPCGVLQTSIVLKPNESIEIDIFLGEAHSVADAQALITRYRTTDLDVVFNDVKHYWDGVLETVQVKTPDRSMDLMLNRWMLYQTLVCRVWARSAFYQASGAYGFRDQLQDGMALAMSQPALTRAHILRAAARQFVEGDVQHWWLPLAGQGVRTHISDDRVWLAYTTAHYIDVTGDVGILDEQVPFLQGQALQPGEHDAYFHPQVTEETASLFEHCARGLDQSLMVGAHGLPLMGTGDWNDGMNRVGELGRGESVWLGWLLHTALSSFIPFAQTRDERKRATQWQSHSKVLQKSLETEAWDGDWYRRGYFDDGTPFGSAHSDECRIDSIAQSWAVLSGAADPERAAQAMSCVDAHLIRPHERLALLFTPPFDHTPLDPGYIKGYPAGIRENGGQYTHAATWIIMAFAKLGQGAKAAYIFSLLNPINHTDTRANMRRYKVEPYVVAADVYSVAPNVGRGGWTWYTGAAGWLYRAGIESILGLRKQGETLLVAPCIPEYWPGYDMVYRYHQTRYEITVENPHGVSHGIASATLDGQALPAGPIRIPLQDDQSTHKLHVVLGVSSAKS